MFNQILLVGPVILRGHNKTASYAMDSNSIMCNTLYLGRRKPESIMLLDQQHHFPSASHPGYSLIILYNVFNGRAAHSTLLGKPRYYNSAAQIALHIRQHIKVVNTGLAQCVGE